MISGFFAYCMWKQVITLMQVTEGLTCKRICWYQLLGGITLSIIHPVLAAMAWTDLSALRDALPALVSAPNATNSMSQTTWQATKFDLKLDVLLWNIHGQTYAGMATARRMLVQEVVMESSPDVLLLQEVAAECTVTKFIARCKPRRSYGYWYSTTKTEAYIVYDLQCLSVVSPINIPGVIGNIHLLGIPSPPTTRGHTSPSQTTPSQKYYSNHTCAIRVQHRATRKELVLMSFHNASTRTLGPKANVVSCAKGFLQLVCMVHRQERVPVIAGGDFNCDRSDLLDHARALGCELPDYVTSERRRSSDKIDFYVIKSSSPLRRSVEVFEALPLADPTSVSAHYHPLGHNRIRYLIDNAPDIDSQGRKLDYTNCTNHDPILNTVCSENFHHWGVVPPSPSHMQFKV